MGSLVDFFIVGSQKAATTALARQLNTHPRVQLAIGKEAHYFDNDDEVDWNCPDHARLHARFDWTERGLLRGDATPVYLFWPQALERLFAYNSNSRIIVGLRHPALRAFSHWRMETSRGREILPFDQAISETGRMRIKQPGTKEARIYSYVERGFYSPQLERLYAIFPLAQIFVYRADRLWQSYERVITECCRFLGLDPQALPSDPRQYVTPVAHLPVEPMSIEARRGLDDLYADDLRLTQAITGLDLSDWLDLAYTEPMQL